ncbi:MAG: type IV toxin-antitoxin system AbiEi family antitoxin domain-containing protein [Thermoleophilaceae bacterium]|nr:type IV toxin-antitoxin system AbiEi family antitoxin domain-containing protein [Thermoleophilaceae bacterium]
MAALAEAQDGVASWAELRRSGLSDTGVHDWVATGRLYPIHPGVYAVGRRSIEIRGRLIAALRYAGPGAMLSHATATWWWQLWGTEPRVIHLSLGGRRRSLPDVRVHERRHLERTTHLGLPVTTVAQTLLDHAATVRFNDLRRGLAEADYRRLLDVDAAVAALGRGRRGSAALRRGLVEHLPQLAHTRSESEDRFVFLCERHGIPLPEVNVRVEGILVDAFWPEQRLIVELDSRKAHDTPARTESDRHKELILRRAGYRVQRYTWTQVTKQAAVVAADVLDALAQAP